MRCTEGKHGAIPLTLIILTLMLAPTAFAQAKFKTLHKFNGDENGGGPSSSLISDAAGNLYGTAAQGGRKDQGVVFELTPNGNGTWTERVLYDFEGKKDGGVPHGNLIFDQDGNLYGTTLVGGTLHCDCGTIFKLTSFADGDWAHTVLYTFTGRKDGGYPNSLIFDQAGNLYGTTGKGGTQARGVVFELSPNQDGTWTESVLHNFKGKDGAFPSSGSLLFDTAGNLYGATQLGGAADEGTVFKLRLNGDGSWTESVLHAFTGGKDGARPNNDVTFDQAGNLYGTTVSGGGLNACSGEGCGVVFKLVPNSNGKWKESVLHRFCSSGLCRDGQGPYAGVISDQAGNLFGTTYSGGDLNQCKGYGCGVVFKLTPNSNDRWNETVLHRFVDHPGAGPAARLLLDAAGNLYGTTPAEDVEGRTGSVFQVAP